MNKIIITITTQAVRLLLQLENRTFGILSITAAHLQHIISNFIRILARQAAIPQKTSKISADVSAHLFSSRVSKSQVY